MRALRSMTVSLTATLIMSAFGQTSNQLAFLSSPTNTLSDGSIVRIEAVSYGMLHHIPPYDGPFCFFKSISPTIMFTSIRQAQPAGRYLGDIWTQAEALDDSGHWYPLQKRSMPNPNVWQMEGYEGVSPSEMSETWEFPHCPKPSPWLRVRIELWPIEETNTNTSSVEFKIPNDEKWREQSAKEQTNGFNEQDWLNNELWNGAYEDQVDYVKELINEGANPNTCDNTGMSALAIASQDGHLDVVRYLLDHGADVNAHSKGKVTDRTALMAAASNDGHPEIVRLLVERGANVNTRGELGWTALIWAAREGDIESVKFLLSKGADPNVKASDGKSVIELTDGTDSPNRSDIVKILKAAQKIR